MVESLILLGSIHVMIGLEVKSDDGRIEKWSVGGDVIVGR
jgi:hypothetical protein